MDQVCSALYVFNTHPDAQDAIRSLGRSGFDVKKLSLIGKGHNSEQTPIGFYTGGDRILTWGSIGAVWGGIWGLLLAPAIFFLPGFGLVAMAGPVVAALVGALEGAVVVGGLTALGAALTQIGIPDSQAIKYETALKAEKYLLMVHGTSGNAIKARSVLTRTKAWETTEATLSQSQQAMTSSPANHHPSENAGFNRVLFP
jgi:hypothetical protein